MDFVPKPQEKDSQSNNPVSNENTDEEEFDEDELEFEITKQTLEEKGRDYVLLAPDNLSASYLIDVKYDGKNEKAYVKLYNPDDERIYRWYDSTNLDENHFSRMFQA